VASVASSYIQLRGLDEQLQISKDTLATYAESVTLFENQFKYGQVSKMNVAQAKSQYQTAAAAIPQIESQIAQLEHGISILLGRNPGPIERGKSIFELTLPDIPAGVPSDVLDHRPDIREAEQTLIAANAQIGAAKALYFPAISLTGSLGTASGELSDLFKGPAKVWSYAGSITGPIFTAGSIAGQVRQAKAAQEAALLSYEAAIQNAFADVENALVGRLKFNEQLDAQEQLVEALSQYAYLAKLQYDGGYSPYLAVLDAEQQLFPAKLNHAQTRASVCAAFVTLYQAMGGGWVVSAEEMTERAPTE
jgi:multidrug efflux system outer membrane protein